MGRAEAAADGHPVAEGVATDGEHGLHHLGWGIGADQDALAAAEDVEAVVAHAGAQPEGAIRGWILCFVVDPNIAGIATDELKIEKGPGGEAVAVEEAASVVEAFAAGIVVARLFVDAAADELIVENLGVGGEEHNQGAAVASFMEATVAHLQVVSPFKEDGIAPATAGERVVADLAAQAHAHPIEGAVFAAGEVDVGAVGANGAPVAAGEAHIQQAQPCCRWSEGVVGAAAGAGREDVALLPGVVSEAEILNAEARGGGAAIGAAAEHPGVGKGCAVDGARTSDAHAGG